MRPTIPGYYWLKSPLPALRDYRTNQGPGEEPNPEVAYVSRGTPNRKQTNDGVLHVTIFGILRPIPLSKTPPEWVWEGPIKIPAKLLK
jgi:hypothetical protein